VTGIYVMGQWMRVPEAARRLGIPAREVYERIDRGDLDGRKIGVSR